MTHARKMIELGGRCGHHFPIRRLEACIGQGQFSCALGHLVLQRVDEPSVLLDYVVDLDQVRARDDERFQELNVLLRVPARLVGDPHHPHQVGRPLLKEGDPHEAPNGRMAL